MLKLVIITSRVDRLQNIAIRKAQELSADTRKTVEQVLGRLLHEDEEVTMMAFAAHDTPQGRDRRILARKLEQQVRKTANRTKSLSDDQLEEVIDEAVRHRLSKRQLS